MTPETLFEASGTSDLSAGALDAFLVRWWCKHAPDAVLVEGEDIPDEGCVLILGVGPVGDAPLLPRLLADPRRLILFRELNPFLAASRLALLVPRSSAEMPVLLERLTDLFRGNLDFLSMAQRLVELARENASLHGVREELRQTRAELTALRSSRVLRWIRTLRELPARLFRRAAG